MVKIRVKRNAAGHVTELTSRGHAGFDDGQGNDLVCAAVSALTGALGLGLTEVAQLPHAVRAEHGVFELRLTDEEGKRVALLTETVTRALDQLDEHYRGWMQVEHRGERKSRRTERL